MPAVKLVLIDPSDPSDIELEIGPFSQGLVIETDSRGVTEIINCANRAPIAHLSEMSNGWVTYDGTDRRGWGRAHVQAVT